MPFQTERENLARRRQVIDALTAKSLQPYQQRTAGGFVMPYGIGDALSQLGPAVIGNIAGRRLSEQEKALAEKERAGLESATQRLMETATGRPQVGTPQMGGPLAAQAGQEYQPYTPASPDYQPGVEADPVKAALMATTDPYLAQNPNAAKVALSLLKAQQPSKSNAQPYFTPEDIVTVDKDGNYIVQKQVLDRRTGQYISGGTERLSPKDPRVRGITKEAEATGTATGKGTTERYQQWADEGLVAADAMATTKKALDLLNDVRTSGFNSVLLRAKQWLGIEGGDEAQLSANLGKAVLAQLRPTFGAQFTEREGAKLDRIEASFGSSVEGNKRLLNQTLQIFERAARRGIRGATNIGDKWAIEEIQRAMKTEIQPEYNAPPKTVTPPVGNNQDILNQADQILKGL